jgi:hypothetical protein
MKSSPFEFGYKSDVDKEQRAQEQTAGSTGSLNYVLSMVLTLLGTVLIVDSLVRAPGAIETGIVSFVQHFDALYAPVMLGAVNLFTTVPFLIVLWVTLTIGAAAYRRWGLLVSTILSPIAVALAVLIDGFSPSRPPLDPSLLDRVVAEAGIFTAAFGQIVATILLFGLLFNLGSSFNHSILRVAVRAISIASIILIGPAQLWIGAIWPSEMAFAYVLGGIFLITLVVLANAIDARHSNLPLIHAASVLGDDSVPHTQALTSTILFNGKSVSKIYRPGFLPRAIYWLAFQAEFPYMRNQAALRSAVLRRNLIGMFTEFWFGSNHVARALSVDRVRDRYAITSEFVEGSEPEDRESAKNFLRDLVARFEEAGFPTWQIDPRQPRATDNVLVDENGEYHVVDLESGLVSPLASLQTWKRAIARGYFPLYDDIFFDVTRSYVEQHEPEMRAKMGDAWVNELQYMVSATERETQRWHDSEPRIWSRLLGRKRQTNESTVAMQQWIISWFDEAIDTWRSENRITETERRELQRNVRSTQFSAVLPHFAVHFGITALLRFPLGAIARVIYTASQFAKAGFAYSRGQISRAEWEHQFSTHSPLVLIISAIPGFGAFAYLASRPIRSNHRLLHIALDAMLLKLPSRVYGNTRLRWLMTESPAMMRAIARVSSEQRRRLPQFGWAHEHRLATATSPQRMTMTHTAGAGVRSIY